MTLNPLQFPGLSTRFTEPGTYGNKTHITREDEGSIPIEHVATMLGRMGEMPGEHRNRHGQQWRDFKHDIAANGIQNPLFITVDPGDHPRLAEGNHRRDAAMELGHEKVPVQIRYFGHAERDYQ